MTQNSNDELRRTYGIAYIDPSASKTRVIELTGWDDEPITYTLAEARRHVWDDGGVLVVRADDDGRWTAASSAAKGYVMSDLLEFLSARLDDDEVGYRALAGAGVDPGHRISLERLFADVEAKRAIVEDPSFRESQNPNRLSIFGERILGRLAAVYADHPDYDEAWRP